MSTISHENESFLKYFVHDCSNTVNVTEYSSLKDRQYSPKLPRIGQSQSYNFLPIGPQDCTMYPFSPGLIDFPILEPQHVAVA